MGVTHGIVGSQLRIAGFRLAEVAGKGERKVCALLVSTAIKMNRHHTATRGALK